MSDDGNTVTALALKLKTPPTRTIEIQSPGTPALLRVREGIVRIGRDAINEVVIDDPFVSRQHLEIRVFPHGVEIADLDTKNGTHFQGARIRELPITSEATLLLGKNITVRIRVVDDAKSRAEVDEFIGVSPSIVKLRSTVQRVAPTTLSVLIEGETGTGKEVVARAVHQRSPRAAKPLVVFDCASVSPSLLASELFGHTKGAYTGATGSTEGAFRRANGGTLFLDEIGELPLDLQPALLRALEARQVRPVGSDAYVSVDVRIIAATNRSLEAEVEAGRFRKDLLFRLAVTRIKTPPLRARPEDVAVLAAHFASALGASLSPPVLAQLSARAWTGNVRELRNCVERAVMLSGGPGVFVTDLDEDDDDAFDEGVLAPDPTSPLAIALAGSSTLPGALPTMGAASNMQFQDAKQIAVDAFEREYLLKLFAESDYNLSEAARRSGVHRRYLRELYKKHGIDLASLRVTRGQS
ncbi:MAG: sigma 54-interacting transcriptional regulator [Deltaproteobacteria bacterium]|nr:sigma 54-interacting transcriptional regulator [Deltaproteobacteria bacterium]